MMERLRFIWCRVGPGDHHRNTQESLIYLLSTVQTSMPRTRMDALHFVGHHNTSLRRLVGPSAAVRQRSLEPSLCEAGGARAVCRYLGQYTHLSPVYENKGQY